MKLMNLCGETAKNKVLGTLFEWPEKEFSLSDLAKEAGVAKANIGEILNDFQKKGIIRIEKLSKIWRIKANLSSHLYLNNKILYNLNFIYNSGLIEFLVDYFKNPKAVVLFGSFRKGEDISSSDIDIAIESSEAKEYLTVRLNELAHFEHAISRRIQMHVFNRKDIDLNVFNNIANGILLWGFLEVNK